MAASQAHAHQRCAHLPEQSSRQRSVGGSPTVIQPVRQSLQRLDGGRVGQDRQQIHQHYGEGVRQDGLRRPLGPTVVPLQSGGW